MIQPAALEGTFLLGVLCCRVSLGVVLPLNTHTFMSFVWLSSGSKVGRNIKLAGVLNQC